MLSRGVDPADRWGAIFNLTDVQFEGGFGGWGRELNSLDSILIVLNSNTQTT
jgi:hypothetical protein